MIQNTQNLTTPLTPTSKRSILSRLSLYFWGPDPCNCLGQTYFISPKKHTIMRYIFAVYHVIVFILGSLALGEFYYNVAYLTMWGFGICMIYFVLVNFVKNSPSTSGLWRFVYMLGELGATLEFLICPFFFAFLFPAFLKLHTSAYITILQICLHLFCPIMIWIETVLNGLSFPKRHMWFLVGVMVVYPINNCIWTLVILKKPVYPVMTWKDAMTFVYIGIAGVIGFAGFFVGRYQYRKKLGRPSSGSRTSFNRCDDEANRIFIN